MIGAPFEGGSIQVSAAWVLTDGSLAAGGFGLSGRPKTEKAMVPETTRSVRARSPEASRG